MWWNDPYREGQRTKTINWIPKQLLCAKPTHARCTAHATKTTLKCTFWFCCKYRLIILFHARAVVKTLRFQTETLSHLGKLRGKFLFSWQRHWFQDQWQKSQPCRMEQSYSTTRFQRNFDEGTIFQQIFLRSYPRPSSAILCCEPDWNESSYSEVRIVVLAWRRLLTASTQIGPIAPKQSEFFRPVWRTKPKLLSTFYCTKQSR